MKTIIALGGRGINFANYVQTRESGYDVYTVTTLSQITEMLEYLKNKKVYVVVGLGGTTGTALAGEMASILSQKEIAFSVYATIPFHFEGKKRLKIAQEALEQMTQNGYTVIIEDNNSILKNGFAEVSSVQEAFVNMDKALCERITG
jgi:cell division protein FtsZ